MKIYQKIKEKDFCIVKLFNLPIFTRKNENGTLRTKFFFGLHSTKQAANIKRYRFLGIRYKKKINLIPNENTNLVPNKKINLIPPAYNITDAFIMEYFCAQQQLKYQNNPLNIKTLLDNSKSIMISCPEIYLTHSHGWTKYLFKGNLHAFDSLPYDNKESDLYLLLGGIGHTPPQISIAVESMQCNKPALILEAGFLRSINTFCENEQDDKYRYDVGFVFDYLTAYYDATRPSYLENLLNDKHLIITERQKQRARNCINKIVENHLTKYNCQPIYIPNIGRKRKKILVVDQSFGDNSIKKGLASTTTFNKMLQRAIEENPDADIIVKTHPDAMTGTRGGYYTGLKQHDNIYPMTAPINPISLIKYCDKVYVCTTQLGFEALMCGKEVHVFGIPFYAGWGLTIDEQKCERRTNKRTLEEMFYIAYIMYSHYVNPDKKCRCEIEEAMDYLLKLREEYFKEAASHE